MTQSNTKNQYDTLVSGSEIVESHLHREMIEHINAEIALGTITTG